MIYRIIARPTWGSFHWGFDKEELCYFNFQLSFCIIHRHLDFNIAAFGLFFDANVYEPEERTIG